MEKESPPQALRSGLEDGDYRLEKPLGAGAMGSVWLARQLSLDRLVAIKFLPPFADQQEELNQRLKTEALSAGKIQHPNVISIFAWIEFQGQGAVVMEYVPGKTLRDLFHQGYRFNLKKIFNFIEQIARGLAASEKVGIVHRDIKPSNLLITEDEHVKILDFGLARILMNPSMTKTGTVLGTAAYMSPEQACGKTTDIRSDFYSLGVITFELFSGFLPYRASHPAQVVRMHLEENVPQISPEKVPEAVNRFIQCLMNKNPAKRPQNTQELLELIEKTFLTCRGEFDVEARRYHSRRLELQLLEGATQEIGIRKKNWKPLFPIAPLLLTTLLLTFLALLSWPRQEVAKKLYLPLDSFPKETRVLLDEQEILPPFPSFLTITPGTHQLVITAPFHQSRYIPFTSEKLPSPKALSPLPDEKQVVKYLLHHLEKNKRSSINLNFLHDLYPQSIFPRSIQKLRREIMRLEKAREYLDQEQPAQAIKLLEAIDKSLRHQSTRDVLELARIYLLPDKKLRNTLENLRKNIRHGEDQKAERAIKNLLQIRPHLETLQHFRRQLDQLRNSRLGVEKALHGGYLKLMESFLDRWKQISPDDPLLEVYRQRLDYEKQKQILMSNRKELLASLKKKEREWNIWVFYGHLKNLSSVGSQETLLQPFLKNAYKKIHLDFCKQLTALLKKSETPSFLDGPVIEKIRKQLKSLKKRHWQWRELSLQPEHIQEKSQGLEMLCRYRASGKFPHSKIMQVHKQLRLIIRLEKIEEGNPLKNPKIIVQKLESLSP
jgi:serine/threonine protein kinase